MLQMFMYRRNDINNGILYSQRGMPQKDFTSDGDGSFAIGRQNYVETANAEKSITQSQKTSKKWYGNRDASAVVDKRRNASIGKGSINNANSAIGFTTDIDRNTARQTLIRTRSGGYVVPPKCVNTPTTTGAFCFAGGHSDLRFNPVTLKATKINQNTDRTKELLVKRDKLGCSLPYDCSHKSTFCKTQC
jgi:hypothetical protein